MKPPFQQLFPEMCKLASAIAEAEMTSRGAKEAWILALMAEGWSVDEYGKALIKWLGAESKVTSNRPR